MAPNIPDNTKYEVLAALTQYYRETACPHMIDPDDTWWGLLELPPNERIEDTEAILDGPSRPSSYSPTDDPLWNLILQLKNLLALVSIDPKGNTRLGQCVSALRNYSQQDQFPESSAREAPWYDVRMIFYPRLEVNQIMEMVKSPILELLSHIEIEDGMKERLNRELQKSTPFLEEDDRGTFIWLIDPREPTREQQRNDVKLEALAAFLAGIRRRPEVVLQTVIKMAALAKSQLHKWEFDFQECTIRYNKNEWTGLPVEVVLYVKMVVDARPPEFVPFKNLKEEARNAGIVISSIKLDYLKKNIPEYIKQMIEFKPGDGARLKP